MAKINAKYFSILNGITTYEVIPFRICVRMYTYSPCVRICNTSIILTGKHFVVNARAGNKIWCYRWASIGIT